jgi:NitT/TauT family transport system substrate-binding protein
MTPVYLAQGLGFFADEGLEVERITTQGGGLELKALLAGQVEFTFTSGDTVLTAYQQGQRLVMVFSGMHRLIFNWGMNKDAARERGVTDGSPVDHKLRALSGLTLGVNQLGGLPQYLVDYALAKVGLSPHKDAKVVFLGPDAAWLAVLESRKIDVAFAPVPFPEGIRNQSKAFLLINNAQGEDPAFPEFLMANLMVRPDYLRKHPETVRRMVRAMFHANHWALTNPPERVAEVLQPFLPRIPPWTLAEGVRTVLPALTQDGLTTERAVEITADVLEKAGLLKKKPPFDEIVMNELVPRQRRLPMPSH